MSNEELIALKEQIKKEVIAEMQTKKENENNWKKLKTEFEEEFDKFDYSNGQRKITTRFAIQGAIGTLLRILYRADNVSKINANYEEMKAIVEPILDILKQNKKK